MHAGDLRLSSAVLLSGNNFAKVNLLSDFLVYIYTYALQSLTVQGRRFFVVCVTRKNSGAGKQSVQEVLKGIGILANFIQ